MERVTEAPDRRPLSAAEAKALAKARIDEWREVREIAKQICERGKPDIRHQIAARFGVWPLFHTLNNNPDNPTGTGIDCETGAFRTIRGAAVTDQEIEIAASIAAAVDGTVVLRQVQIHLNRA